jgi:hypothetical protein
MSAPKAAAAEADRIVSSIMSRWRNNPEAKDVPVGVLTMLAMRYAIELLRKNPDMEPETVKTIIMGSVEVGCDMAGLPESARQYVAVVPESEAGGGS